MARVGTGVVELLLDEEKLKNAQEVAMPELGYDEDGMMDIDGLGSATPGVATPGVATPYGFGYGAYGGGNGAAGGASPGGMLTPFGAAGDLSTSPMGASPFISPMVSPGRMTPG